MDHVFRDATGVGKHAFFCDGFVPSVREVLGPPQRLHKLLDDSNAGFGDSNLVAAGGESMELVIGTQRRWSGRQKVRKICFGVRAS